jgi:hypothetical protein
VYCSPTPPTDELFKSIKNIEFIQGLPDTSIFNPKETNLLIIDDLMSSALQSNEIMQLFCVNAHHNNISTIMMVHNLFSKDKHSRTISLNSNYIVLFKSPRDKSQCAVLARQMYPKNPKFLIEAYENATQDMYSYLLLDLTQKQDENFRVQSKIFSSSRIIYQPK